MNRGECRNNRRLRRIHEHVARIEVAEARGLDDAAEYLLCLSPRSDRFSPKTLRLTTAGRSLSVRQLLASTVKSKGKPKDGWEFCREMRSPLGELPEHGGVHWNHAPQFRRGHQTRVEQRQTRAVSREPRNDLCSPATLAAQPLQPICGATAAIVVPRNAQIDDPLLRSRHSIPNEYRSVNFPMRTRPRFSAVAYDGS